MVECYFYHEDNGNLVCDLCPNNCIIKEGNVGICKGRKNIDGKLYLETYGQVAALHIDHIEKKPLHYFYPGSLILSVGTYGCNLSCSFCQNYEISQFKTSTETFSSEDLLEFAKRDKRNIGIAFTYNEPFIWYEFVYDTLKLFKENNLKTVLVTNGYVNKEPLKKILPYVDAMNIDLKSYNQDFYKNIAKGNLDDVKNTIYYSNSKTHVEVTFLLIEKVNDNIVDFENMCLFIKKINQDIPLHIIRFYPRYKMKDKNATSMNEIFKFGKIAEKYLNHVIY